MLNAEPRQSSLRIAWLAVVTLAWAVTFVLTVTGAIAATQRRYILLNAAPNPTLQPQLARS